MGLPSGFRVNGVFCWLSAILLLPDSSAEAMVVSFEIVSKVSRFNMNKSSCSSVVVRDR